MTSPEPTDFTSGPPITDFTPERPVIRFKIDGDIFEGLPDIPSAVLMRFAARMEGMDERQVTPETAEIMTDILRMCLKPDSAALFIKRLDDLERPIGLTTFVRLIPWLFEQYGMRPTLPSSDSSGGLPSPDDGTSLTASTPDEASTSSLSPSTDF